MKTLYDSIVDKKAFEQTIFAAVHKALVDLGPDVASLPWANISVSVRERAADASARDVRN